METNLRRVIEDENLRKIFHDNIPSTNLLLRLIFGDSELKVNTVKAKRSEVNEQVRLEILAQDSNDKYLSIHVVKENALLSRDDDKLRTFLEQYEQHSETEISETCIVVLSEKDLYGLDVPVYTDLPPLSTQLEYAKPRIRIAYVNGSYRRKNPIGLLIADLFSEEPINYDLMRLDSITFCPMSKF